MSPQTRPKTDGFNRTDASDARIIRKQHAARLSVGSNAGLVLLKLIIGFGSGSVSVLSEAAHSAGDLLASGIAYFSVKASDLPPDRDHPYGHGKIESISGLAEALLLIFAATYVIYEAVNKLLHPSPTEMKGVALGLGVMALSAVLNFFLSIYLHRVAIETDSPALTVDAAHLRSDVFTSVGVFVGLALAKATGNALFDPLTALIVSAMILLTAARLCRESLLPLLDARLPAEEEKAILDVLDGEDQVLAYHKLRTRKSGSQRHADVHVLIDDHCTLVQAHDLTEMLEDRIREALPAIHVHIHVEPYEAEMKHQQEVHGVILSTGKSNRKITS